MKSIRGLLSLALIFSTGFITFISPLRHAVAQDNVALQRGYRTGYSDGYMAGYRDLLDSQTKDLSRHPDYGNANRAYAKDYGPIEEYRDGYKQGFEAGYDSGFEKRSFDSTAPPTLARRDESTPPQPIPTTTTGTTAPAVTDQPTAAKPPQADTTVPAVTDQNTTPPATTVNETAAVTTQSVTIQTDTGSITIAKGTELILELQNPVSTDKNREGDRFTAKVVSPIELSGAMIEGRVNKIQKPGRIKKRSQLAMSFDRIIINENRWGNFSAVLTEVLPVKGDNIRRVDDEGTAVGKSTVKPDAIKVGAATGSGAAIGAVTGGPVGAAVGAGVGAAFGVGAVVIERGKDIRLNVNQQLRVKSAYDTQIR